MFVLNASKAFLNVLQRELITSGAVHAFRCQFRFSGDWDGLDKTAVFCAGKDKISVVLGPDDTCDIPWEVLRNTCADLHVGVYGTRDDALILPTVWAHLGQIKPGASPGTNATPPTPDVYSQILSAATSAEELAQSVRDDADAGEFDGPPGVSPHIGENGNWWVGDTDTGVYSGGEAPVIGENGNWYVGGEDTGVPATGPSGPAGKDGTAGAPGKDGAPGAAAGFGTPTVTVDGTSGVPSATVTASGPDTAKVFAFEFAGLKGADGQDGADGLPGQPGPAGKDGADGGYYTPSVSASGDLTWTGSEPGMPQIPGANIMGPAGADGTPGAQGPPGRDGADGHTPVRGVDYWTQADQQQMVQDVIAALPVYNGEVE